MASWNGVSMVEWRGLYNIVITIDLEPLPCGGEPIQKTKKVERKNGHGQNFGKRMFLKPLFPIVCTLTDKKEKPSRIDWVWTLEQASPVN